MKLTKKTICGKLRAEIKDRESTIDDERRKKKTLERTMVNEGENASKIVSFFGNSRDSRQW